MNPRWLLLIVPGAITLGILVTVAYLIWVWNRDRP